jgi:hypothetical protein
VRTEPFDTDRDLSGLTRKNDGEFHNRGVPDGEDGTTIGLEYLEGKPAA